MAEQRHPSPDKRDKKLPGKEPGQPPKEKHVDERASTPERPVRQDPQFDPDHIQED